MTYGPILGPALQLFADPVHASAFFTLGLSLAGSKSAFAVIGAAGAAIVLAAAGAGSAYVMNGPRGRAVVRVLGSWSAALGLILLGLALRG